VHVNVHDDCQQAHGKKGIDYCGNAVLRIELDDLVAGGEAAADVGAEPD